MAVFTELQEEDIDWIVRTYGLPRPTTICGIADGKADSTYLITSGGKKYIATIFESDVSSSSLEDTFQVMEFLFEQGFPCPPPLRTLSGDASIAIATKIAALVGFVPGVSTSRPTLQRCESLARRIAELHLLLQPALAKTNAGLVEGTVHGAVHAENVFYLGSNVGGIINYRHRHRADLVSELADMIARYATSESGTLEKERAGALVSGYSSIRALSDGERAALPSFVVEATLRSAPTTRDAELRRKTAADTKKCILSLLSQAR